MRYEIPQYLFDWMKTQSNSAFIGDMLLQYNQKGGLTEAQLLEVKIRFIQSGGTTPAMMGVK